MYHNEKVSKASDQRGIVWFVSSTCYSEETLARVFQAFKTQNVLFYMRNRCFTGRSCSKADQRLTQDSFSFVKNISLDNFSQLFLRVSNQQLIGKMKLSHLSSNFARTLLA